jgi:Family of unknown function (DUF5317)
MFALYAVLVAMVLAALSGGRLSGLAELRFRWANLALGGLLVQLLLFLPPVAERVGAAGVPIYVASSAVVLVAVLANTAIPGMRLVAVGAASNLVAIVANGGYMPASPSALAALGKEVGETYSNSAVVPDPVLPGLTDIWAMPAWMPFANVFSIGDLLLALGIGYAIWAGMRRQRGASRNLPPMSHATGTDGSWQRG